MAWGSGNAANVSHKLLMETESSFGSHANRLQTIHITCFDTCLPKSDSKCYGIGVPLQQPGTQSEKGHTADMEAM